MPVISCALAPSLDTPAHIELAERLGYRRAWCYDSPALCADPWMVLALAAGRTRAIGLGPASLVPSLRHPMVTAAALATLGAKATGLLVCSGTPPVSSAVPGVQTYIGQVNAYHAATHDAAANPATMRNNAMVAWVGTQAIFAIGKTIPDLTASNLRQALSSVKNLKLPIVPPWTPSQQGIAGFTAISDPWTYQMVDQDGQLQLVGAKPVNETTLLK